MGRLEHGRKAAQRCGRADGESDEPAHQGAVHARAVVLPPGERAAVQRRRRQPLARQEAAELGHAELEGLRDADGPVEARRDGGEVGRAAPAAHELSGVLFHLARHERLPREELQLAQLLLRLLTR